MEAVGDERANSKSFGSDMFGKERVIRKSKAGHWSKAITNEQRVSGSEISVFLWTPLARE